ncbi:MAG: D-alanyl-D-alanine carboxypeptidase [Candidatus Berkelbacteria bacterium]|nr:D-alanyl-D-alanine carboxypeptidase [Candidatus Berkelbacteria bacterium]
MKKIFFIIALTLICISITYYLFNHSKKPGSILGTSINNFYQGKEIKISQIPQKKNLTKDPTINAESTVLINEPDKYVLFGKNEDNPVAIASVTKIMTATIALEIYKPTDIVEIKKENTEINGSKVFLKEGEKLTVEDLMYCLLLNSGNDAAKTLGNTKITEKEFVGLMNKKATELGLTNTHFMDTAGLDDTGHSSARDIAILFSYALKNPEFKKIVSTAEKQVISQDKSQTHDLKNSNRLTTGEIPLDGVIGGKTGFTPDAGHTLVTAASKDGHTIIGVVLKTDSDTAPASAIEMQKLLEWGFNSYDFK